MHRIRKRAEPAHFQNWKTQFLVEHGRQPVYDDLRGTAEYGKLITELMEEQGYICCYCEKGIRARYCDIEHFLPRHPDKTVLTAKECRKCQNAQLDYHNLFASCLGDKADSSNHCNHKKDNWFDFRYCISPECEDIEGIFGFRINGKIFAVDNNVCAQQMKEHLNLDTYILQEQRKAAFDTAMDEEYNINPDWTNSEKSIADTIEFYKEKNDIGKYNPFCSMITYCIEQYL